MPETNSPVSYTHLMKITSDYVGIEVPASAIKTVDGQQGVYYDRDGAVSYTHLDVYKRQGVCRLSAGADSLRGCPKQPGDEQLPAVHH